MLTLLGMTKKPLVKACCGNCAIGKPCCDSPPKIGDLEFEDRGGILLPKRRGIKNAMWGPSGPNWERLFRGLFPLAAVQFDMSCLPCCAGGCNCDNWPDSLTATVTATNAACAANLGNSTTITEAGLGTSTDDQWGGTLSGVGTLAFSCGSGILGCSNGVETSLSSTGQCAIAVTRVCFTCDPPTAVFVCTAVGLTCCTGVGTKEMTITVTG